MPAISTITVNNRESSPVAVAFEPQSIENGVATFLNSTGVPIGDKSISVSSRRAGQKQKVRIVMKDPIVQTETVDGISTPKVVRTSYADVTFTFDTESDQQERENLVGMFANTLLEAQTMLNETLVELKSIY